MNYLWKWSPHFKITFHISVLFLEMIIQFFKVTTKNSTLARFMSYLNIQYLITTKIVGFLKIVFATMFLLVFSRTHHMSFSSWNIAIFKRHNHLRSKKKTDFLNSLWLILLVIQAQMLPGAKMPLSQWRLENKAKKIVQPKNWSEFKLELQQPSEYLEFMLQFLSCMVRVGFTDNLRMNLV
jgi:hypothetical protein